MLITVLGGGVVGSFEQFPYTNFHELNLDWIIEKIKEFKNEIDNIDDNITTIVQEYLSEVELNTMYIPATETIVLSFEDK